MTYPPLIAIDKRESLRRLAESVGIELPPLVISDFYESIRRICAASGVPVPSPLVLADPGAAINQVKAAIEAGGGSEGGAPEPVALIDFKNAVYTLDGSSVSVGTIFGDSVGGSFPDRLDWITPGTGLVVPSGHAGGTSVGALLGDALSAALTSGIVVVRGSIGSGAQLTVYVVDDPNWTTEWDIITGAVNSTLSDNGSGFEQIGNAGEGAFALAAFLSSAELAASRDGGAAVSVPNPIINGALNAVGFYATTGFTIERIEVYSGLTSADLPGLSGG